MVLTKKTVDSILAPFAKMKADLEALVEDKRKAIGTRNERMAVLKIENEMDHEEIGRAVAAAQRIEEITLA